MRIKKKIKKGIWKKVPYWCGECGNRHFEKVYFPSKEEIKEKERKDKIRSEKLRISLAKQEKKLFGKYDKTLAKVSVTMNHIGRWEMLDAKRRKTIKRYASKRINKSDRLVKFYAQG